MASLTKPQSPEGLASSRAVQFARARLVAAWGASLVGAASVLTGMFLVASPLTFVTAEGPGIAILALFVAALFVLGPWAAWRWMRRRPPLGATAWGRLPFLALLTTFVASALCAMAAHSALDSLSPDVTRARIALIALLVLVAGGLALTLATLRGLGAWRAIVSLSFASCLWAVGEVITASTAYGHGSNESWTASLFLGGSVLFVLEAGLVTVILHAPGSVRSGRFALGVLGGLVLSQAVSAIYLLATLSTQATRAASANRAPATGALFLVALLAAAFVTRRAATTKR